MSQTGSSAPACMNGATAPPTLAAPSRPQFYAGQLLTDSDLAAIVDWSRALRGLDRFVLGWGAVCGLSVTADPANPSGLIVGSGYAIGPWGDDLVLGADAKLDLSAQCPKQAGGCAKKPATPATTDSPKFGIPAGNVTELDVFLMPSATPTDPRRMAGISLNLPGDTAIHYARVTDGAAPCVAAPSAVATDPVTTFGGRLSAWRTAAIKFVTKVQAASDTLTGSAIYGRSRTVGLRQQHGRGRLQGERRDGRVDEGTGRHQRRHRGGQDSRRRTIAGRLQGHRPGQCEDEGAVRHPDRPHSLDASLYPTSRRCLPLRPRE